MGTRPINVLSERLTPKETAIYLNISIPTLWRYVKNGVLPKPSRLTPRTILFSKKKLDAYLEEREQ